MGLEPIISEKTKMKLTKNPKWGGNNYDKEKSSQASQVRGTWHSLSVSLQSQPRNGHWQRAHSAHMQRLGKFGWRLQLGVRGGQQRPRRWGRASLFRQRIWRRLQCAGALTGDNLVWRKNILDNHLVTMPCRTLPVTN